MLNKVTIMGHLVRDAEMRYTTSGKGVTNFTVAVNRDFGDDTDFLKTTAWDRGKYKLAEYTGEYRKGDLVLVAGEIRQQNYEDKQGNKRQDIFINADKCFNFSRKKSSNKNEVNQEDMLPDDFDVPF